jgi:hypothetical protein
VLQLAYFGDRVRSMESRRKVETESESMEALKRALIGVKDQREEAFLLLNAIPEQYLTDIVEYFRILTGLKNSPSRIC